MENTLVIANDKEKIYNSWLEKSGVTYQEGDFYIKVGTPSCGHGWILYISISVSQMGEALDAILPVLVKSSYPFKIIKNRHLHDLLNTGSFGDFNTGKDVAILLDRIDGIEEFIRKLIPLTDWLKGPVIRYGLPVTRALYARYGSYEGHIEADAFGNLAVIMEDKQGNSLVDKIDTPAMVPRGAGNPFVSFIDFDSFRNRSNWIGGRALPLKMLKEDVKGNVWLGLYYSGLFSFRLCVIKQGIGGMFADLYGRDMIDRMEVQRSVVLSVQKLVRTPSIIDFFIERNKSYLIIKYIGLGEDLVFKIRDEFKGAIWYTQGKKTRRKFLKYFIDILAQIRLLHLNGRIHRDITGTNFYIDFWERVNLIDLELAYSSEDGKPNPSFRGGTPGYMSPQQERHEVPRFSDDIYSLGAVLFLIIAGGVEPKAFWEEDDHLVEQKVFFMSRDRNLSELISKCMSSDETERPTIDVILEEVESYSRRMKKIDFLNEKAELIDLEEIEGVARGGIKSLSSDFFSFDGLWFSRVENGYSIDVYPMVDRHVFATLYRGVGGVVFFLCEMKSIGYNLKIFDESIKKSLWFISKTVLERLGKTAPSLYFGTAGVAMTLAKSIRAGFIDDSPFYREKIEGCFSIKPQAYNVIDGLAGCGLAMLRCRSFLEEDFVKGTLNQYAGILIAAQKDDGTWGGAGDQIPGKKVDIGFGFGVSGIAYFLMEYGKFFNDVTAFDAAMKGMEYIMRRKFKMSRLSVFGERRKTLDDFGWCDGGFGIAFAFLRGYELTGFERYLRFAVSILKSFPRCFVIGDLSQSHGISGIGEVYLEAYRITQNVEWFDRATWIASYLDRFKMSPLKDEYFWLVNSQSHVTADFMCGNSGVMHFLARYLNPTKISYPILSSPLNFI